MMHGQVNVHALFKTVVLSLVLEYYWSNWTPCSKTCGNAGVRRRIKVCKSASLDRFPNACQALLQESEEEQCNNKSCPGRLD